MKEYVYPEMEIDLFEDNNGLLLTASSTLCDCDIAFCSINFSYDEGEDPWALLG